MTIITERQTERERTRQKDRKKSLAENESRHPNLKPVSGSMWTRSLSACLDSVWPRRAATHIHTFRLAGNEHTHTLQNRKHTLKEKSFSTWLRDWGHLHHSINTPRWVTSQTQLCRSYVVNTRRHQIKPPLLRCLRSSFVSRRPEEREREGECCWGRAPSLDGWGSSRQGEGERQRSCQTNRNLIRRLLSGCPQCVHILLGLIMNNPLYLINKWSEGIHQG